MPNLSMERITKNLSIHKSRLLVRAFLIVMTMIISIGNSIFIPNGGFETNVVSHEGITNNNERLTDPLSSHNLTATNVYSLNSIEQAVKYEGAFYSTRDFVVYGDYLFFVEGGVNLRALNLSDPAHPQYLGYFSLAETIRHIQIDGDFIYCASGSAIYRINITNPANMQSVGYFSGYFGEILTFSIIESTLYLITYSSGNSYLLIFINDNWGPGNYVSSYGLGSQYYRRMVNYQHYIIAGSDLGNVQMIQILDPTNPLYITQRFLSISQIKNLKLFGMYLFVATSSIFYILNSTTLDSISELSLLDVIDFSLEGNVGYVANSSAIFIINLTDEKNVQAIAQLNTGTTVFGITVYGNFMFVGTLNSLLGIQIARHLGTPESLVDNYNDYVNKVRIFGYYAYICTDHDVRILDLRLNSIIGIYNHMNYGVRDVYQNGNFLYVLLSTDIIHIVDITHPLFPIYYSEFNLGFINCYSLSGSPPFLFVSMYGNGVAILNITNPGQFSLLSRIEVDSGEQAYESAYFNRTLYIADYNKLCVYDVNDIRNPVNLYNLSVSYIFSLEISFPYLIVGTSTGYDVYNITTNPIFLLNSWNTGGFNTLEIRKNDDLLYLARNSPGLQINNASRFSQNQILYQTISGSTLSVAAFHDKVIISKLSDGYSILKVRETPSDNPQGTPLLETLWVNRTQTNNTVPPPDQKNNETENPPDNPSSSSIDWKSLLTFGSPIIVILAIVYVVIKSRGRKSGPKVKSIKNITKNSIPKGASSSDDDFFDSDL